MVGNGYRKETKHRMTRRRAGWDYCAPGAYMITLTLADRSRGWLGALETRGESQTREQACGHYNLAAGGGRGGGQALDGGRGGGQAAGEGNGAFYIALSPLGRLVAEKLLEIEANWPGVEIVDFVVMPEHLHFILKIVVRQRHPLGQIVGSFKARSTAAARAMTGRASASKLAGTIAAPPPSPPTGGIVPPSLLGGSPLWSPGLVDSILWSDERFARARAYIADNPRRLAAKRANPALFTVRRDLAVALPLGDGGADITAHFSAIGNDSLLERLDFHQVQCSRRYFAYARDKYGAPLKDRPPEVETAEFRERLDEALAAAEEGAVLVNPCISHGEREIARRAFAAAMVALRNKGFSPLFKPEGSLFDRCADGRLLMLAPAAWPYTPGNRPMTREDACALNRIAQAIARDGAADIDYKGRLPSLVEQSAAEAVAGSAGNGIASAS